MGVPGILDQRSPGPASCADPSTASVAAQLQHRVQTRKLTWAPCGAFITNSVDMSLSKLWEMVRDGGPGMLQSTRSQRVRHD